MEPNSYPDIPKLPTPSQIDFRPYVDCITMAVSWAHKHRGAPDHITNLESDLVIYFSFLTSEPKLWETKFRDSQNYAGFNYRNPDIYWRTIALGVATPKALTWTKKLDPNTNLQKYTIKTSTQPRPKEITPAPAPPKTKPTPKKKPISTYAMPRPSTVSEYILRKSPSAKYDLLYRSVLRHHNRGLSEYGKKIYSKGRAYMIKATHLKPRTIDHAWAWLKREGIFNKARNENHDKGRCALWYVCTSMKQVYYFRDPAKRRRKTKPQDRPIRPF